MTLLYVPLGQSVAVTAPEADKNVRKFNVFMPNGISHPYQLDKSISNLRVVG